MALQFCDGEDLISLYWSTWTMIQVGSLIAMAGIILALANTLRNRRHPYVKLPSIKSRIPLTEYQTLGSRTRHTRSCHRRFPSSTPRGYQEASQEADPEEDGLQERGRGWAFHESSVSQIIPANTCILTDHHRNTIEVDSSDEMAEVRGEIIGFTVQGGPIVRFTDAVPESLPNHAQLLGYGPDNKPVVIIQRDAVQFITHVPLQRPESSMKSFRKGSQ